MDLIVILGKLNRSFPIYLYATRPDLVIESPELVSYNAEREMAMRLSKKFSWKLYHFSYSFIKGSGQAMIPIGVILIICGVCLLGPPLPSEESERMLLVYAMIACLTLGVLMIWGGAKLSDIDSGPLLWLRLKFTYKLQIRAALRAAKEVRRRGIRWDAAYTGQVISDFIDGQKEPVNTGGQIAWDAYRKYARP